MLAAGCGVREKQSTQGEEAVIRMTEKLLRGYAEEMLSEAAYMSLLDELYTTPKPGLVDKITTGRIAI